MPIPSLFLRLSTVLALSVARSDDWGPVPQPAGLRLEHFVLEIREAGSAAPRREPREVGCLCLRSRPVEGGRQLECECVFRLDGLEGESEHVLHVERSGPQGPRLVWREWGPGRGRCLTADWTEDGKAVHMVESSRGGMPRETLSAGDGAVLPLALLELAREGKAESGRYLRLDPLSRELEPVELMTSIRRQPGVEARVVELVRTDGSSAGRFEFHGTELDSFQWQDGDLFARRVSAEAYEERIARALPDERHP